MNGKNDRELLELAAKAAGYDVEFDKPHPIIIINGVGKYWDPLIDDGDALRLAVALKISVTISEFNRTVCRQGTEFRSITEHGEDAGAATRRAIVLAASYAGEEMP